MRHASRASPGAIAPPGARRRKSLKADFARRLPTWARARTAPIIAKAKCTPHARIRSAGDIFRAMPALRAHTGDITISAAIFAETFHRPGAMPARHAAIPPFFTKAVIDYASGPTYHIADSFTAF